MMTLAIHCETFGCYGRCYGACYSIFSMLWHAVACCSMICGLARTRGSPAMLQHAMPTPWATISAGTAHILGTHCWWGWQHGTASAPRLICTRAIEEHAERARHVCA
jgi:hypothetical protein